MHRHFRGAHSKTHQGAEHVVVGRGFDRDRVALRREQANREGNSLARPVAEHDFVGRYRDVRLAQPVGDRLAQAQMALGVAVQKKLGPTRVEHLFEALAKCFDGIERGIGDQGVERHRRIEGRIARTPRVEVQQLFDLCAQRQRDLFALGALGTHKGSTTHGGLDQARGGQRFIRHRNRVPVDSEHTRKRANGR